MKISLCKAIFCISVWGPEFLEAALWREAINCGCAPFRGCVATASIPPRRVMPSLGIAQAAAVLHVELALLQVMIAIQGNTAAHRTCFPSN